MKWTARRIPESPDTLRSATSRKWARHFKCSSASGLAITSKAGPKVLHAQGIRLLTADGTEHKAPLQGVLKEGGAQTGRLQQGVRALVDFKVGRIPDEIDEFTPIILPGSSGGAGGRYSTTPSCSRACSRSSGSRRHHPDVELARGPHSQQQFEWSSTGRLPRHGMDGSASSLDKLDLAFWERLLQRCDAGVRRLGPM